MPKRPPFTGIHETPTSWGGRLPDEGGGPQPPYGEDIIQRIVDVNWVGAQGAIFIFGDECCFNYYVRVTAKGEVTGQELGTFDFTPAGNTSSASFGMAGAIGQSKGKPTFCLGGHNGHGVGLIVASNDGLQWARAIIAGRDIFGISTDNMVWDGQRFYADTYFGAGTGVMVSMASANGFFWSIYGQGSALSHSPVKLPDGQWGYNPASGQFLTASEMGVDALTFAGGIWAYGEHKDMFISMDDAANWIQIGSTPTYGITALAGGALSNFS